MSYFWDSLKTKAYWRYAVFSSSGLKSVLAIFGSIYLLIEFADFFSIYTRDEYASYAWIIVIIVSFAISIIYRRPIGSVQIRVPNKDYQIEVRVGDLFDSTGAVVISTNTDFEADVAGGKIDPSSLQGQFTQKYFAGAQDELVDQLSKELAAHGDPPFSMGTVVPIQSHGQVFYFCAMAKMGDGGNASTTLHQIGRALNGLWEHLQASGDLQELSMPLMGKGRGRITDNHERVIEQIVGSFVEASQRNQFAHRLSIVVHPSDARRYELNLWEIKDRLDRAVRR